MAREKGLQLELLVQRIGNNDWFLFGAFSDQMVLSFHLQ